MENNIVNMNTNSVSGAGATNVAPVTAIQGSNVSDIRQKLDDFYIGDFGGKPRYIKFDLNAFAEMEDRFGTMEEAQKRLEGGSMKDVRTVMWLGLIWDETELDPVTGDLVRYTLSERQVGSWLDTTNLREVMSRLQQAISGSLPEEEQGAPVQQMNAAAAAQVPSNPN